MSQTVTLGQQKDLASALIQGIPEDLLSADAQYWIGHKKELHKKLGGILRRMTTVEATEQLIVTYPTTEVFPLIVNYGEKVEELVKAGKYGWSNDNINSKNFPTERKGEIELEAALVHFDKEMNSLQVPEELDKMGYRAGENHELLAFGIQYPEKQREFPMVELGSVYHLDGRKWVSYLCKSGEPAPPRAGGFLRL